MSAASNLGHTPLGQPCAYPQAYDPTLLCPIARAPQRAELGLHTALPFTGADLWTAYELSWLNPRGKPHVALAQLTVPCETPNLIESKSLKLYFNSLANARFESPSALVQTVRADLTACLWGDAPPLAPLGVRLVGAEAFDDQMIAELDGLDLDRLDLDCDPQARPDTVALVAAQNEAPVTETLTSRLLRSLCPVTGQPDWGSVSISYFGPAIDQAALLRYLVSYRNHAGFHEHCVERIYCDIWRQCRPHQLTVLARYTRRGGIDINPLRSSAPLPLPPWVRTARQ